MSSTGGQFFHIGLDHMLAHLYFRFSLPQSQVAKNQRLLYISVYNKCTESIELECPLSMMLNTLQIQKTVYFSYTSLGSPSPPLPLSSLSAHVLPQALWHFTVPYSVDLNLNLASLMICILLWMNAVSMTFLRCHPFTSYIKFSHAGLWFTSAPQQSGNSSAVLCQPSFGWASFWISTNFTGQGTGDTAVTFNHSSNGLC